MVRIDIEYQGDLHCRALHGPSQHSLKTDAPTDNGGEGGSFSPTDLVATAYGTCVATILGLQAKKCGIDLTGMLVEVTKEMTVSNPRRIARLSTVVRMPIQKSADPKCVLEQSVASCPVGRSLHPEVEKPIAFLYRAG